MFGRLPSLARSDRLYRSAGFSFVEILFAVAVLGVGFIMLAAIFPVGLQQTKLTLDETTAAANARGAIATMQKLAEKPIRYKNSSNVYVETTVLPSTYAGRWPTVGNGLNQVPAGGSRTFSGQVRSLRDARIFSDAWNPAINDPPRSEPVREMVAADVPFRRSAIWNTVNNELFSKSNDRNASIVLYRRDVTFTAPRTATPGSPADVPIPDSSAQIIVINAQVANQSQYVIGKDASGTAAPIFNLEPRPVFVTIQEDGNGTGAWIATFGGVGNAPVTVPAMPAPILDHTAFPNNAAYGATPGAVAEGAFIVISDDRITTPGLAGRLNGRIYRIGNFRNDTNPAGWELAPGYSFVPDAGLNGVPYKAGGTPAEQVKDDITAIGIAGNLPGGGATVSCDGPAVAYVLGKGFIDSSTTPTNPNGYVGPAQDVAAYTTFIPVK